MQITPRLADFTPGETIRFRITMGLADIGTTVHWDIYTDSAYEILVASRGAASGEPAPAPAEVAPAEGDPAGATAEPATTPAPRGRRGSRSRGSTTPPTAFTVVDCGDEIVGDGGYFDIEAEIDDAGTYVLEVAAGTVDATVYDFTVGGHTVTNVQLIRQISSTGAFSLTTSVAGYHGFAQYLQNHAPDDNIRAAWGVLDQTTDRPVPQPTPPYGLAFSSYDALIKAALEYVQSFTCTSFLDLLPDGYLDDRQAVEPLLLDPSPLPAEIGLPCVELIWNYWDEEGMLVQTLNHIVARFQNRRAVSGDPLARFDSSPLLPLRSLLWSWVENEQRRLTVRRRAAEYEFEYGLRLIGKAVPPSELLVERRSGFLRAFHTVLHQATVFFKELDDLTITPDGFPLYEALRECHLILSQGTQNQYGEMAVAARAEMLVMQHILAQPPMREFLGGRPMTPYPEAWMDRVDSMKAIQGWTDTSVLHYHDLATFGERLVLTVRLGNWASSAVGGPSAALWATAFRAIIQRYIASYRAVSGVDLAKGVDDTMPSVLIARRMADTRRRA